MTAVQPHRIRNWRQICSNEA